MVLEMMSLLNKLPLPTIAVNLSTGQVNAISDDVLVLMPGLEHHEGMFLNVCERFQLSINIDIKEMLQPKYSQFFESLLPFTQVEGDLAGLVWSLMPGQVETDVFLFVANQSVAVAQAMQALQAQNNQMRFVLDRVPYFLFWKDKHSIFLGCNHLFAETAKLNNSSEIIGKSDFELPWSDEESRAYIADDQEVIQSRRSKLNIQETQTINGKEITLLTSKVPLFNKDGSVDGVLGIYTDITKLKETQKALEEQKQIAESANIAKSNFLATISHELRTPLNGIMGTVQVLRGRADVAGFESQLNDIYVAADTLTNLVNDVLDFTSMERGRLSLKLMPFTVVDVTHQVIKELTFAAEKKDLTLLFDTSLDANTKFMGDPLRIRQVVTNLVGNAIKFTQAGSVSLNVIYRETPTPQLEFIVSDTGIGMSPEQQSIVFRRFIQVESRYDRRFEGVGLGLAICKELVETMGGEITLNSVLGEGSTFQFYVPVTEVVHQPVSDDESIFAAVSGRILLVEDNPLNRRVFQMMLDEFPLQIDVAENGFEALSYISQYQYDLVFLDISLPDMDGITIANKIRETHPKESLPIIAVTAHAFESDKMACLDAGMNDIIIKPVNMQILHRVIASYLGVE